ncbi:MAG: AAA family ATPase [Acutalibacteraceae bacterium]
MEKHTVSRLVGSPPGYVGYEEGGQLTERVRRRPWCVLLFDEMEKAHPDIYDLLLQVLGDGFLTDSSGRKVNFRNTIVILTSNLGAREISDSTPLGFASGEPGAEQRRAEIRRAAMAEVRRQLRPEFLGRLDQIVVFDALGQEELRQIAGHQLQDLARRVLPLGFHLEFDPSLVDSLIDEKACRSYGARPVLKAIREKVEDPLADASLAGTLPEGKVLCRRENDRTVFEKIG